MLLYLQCKEKEITRLFLKGIIDEDVDQSIRNLTKIGSKGMNETDKLVLEIMTSK